MRYKKIIFPLCLIFSLFICGSALAAKPGSHKKVFFVHHSTGEIYWNGGMSKALKAHGYKGRAPWWDNGTDPQDFTSLFKDKNSWKIFGSSDIIIFKSCYPASNIENAAQLKNYKKWYKQLYAIYKAHPKVLFVPMSTPPLPKTMTNSAEAKRSLAFEKWLKTDYVKNYSGHNLLPFGLHSLLSDKSGYLKSTYVSDPYDGHPKPSSGKAVGNSITKLLDNYFKK